MSPCHKRPCVLNISVALYVNYSVDDGNITGVQIYLGNYIHYSLGHRCYLCCQVGQDDINC